MKPIIFKIAIGVALIANTAPLADIRLKPNSACDDGLEFRLEIDKNSYTPGTTIHVRFVVRNDDSTPLYFFRNIGQCSSQIGWLALDLRDQNNHEVESWSCSADDFDFGKRDVAAILSASETGILLNKSEAYIREVDYQLPKQKGTFRLHAELAPPGYLTDKQRAALSKRNIRVLKSTCVAAPLTISVK